MEKRDKLKKIIDDSENIVFFSGAGVSTESGIKDFRSQDGLYSLKFKYPPEYMLSANMFYLHTEEFFDFYRTYLDCRNAAPNLVHKYLAKLESSGKLCGIITQNIDGLHTKAGSKHVCEIHGTILRNHCIECGCEYDANFVFGGSGIPICKCGGIVKPDVVLYGESLPEAVFSESCKLVDNADTLVAIGSSLTVEPAASLVRNFKGKHLVIINRDNTPYDDMAELVINDELGHVFNGL